MKMLLKKCVSFLKNLNKKRKSPKITISEHLTQNKVLFLCPKKGKSIAGGRAARLFPEKRETGCGAAAIAAACLAVAKSRRGAPRRFVEISLVLGDSAPRYCVFTAELVERAAFNFLMLYHTFADAALGKPRGACPSAKADGRMGAAAIAAACLAVAKPRRGAPRRFVEISGV